MIVMIVMIVMVKVGLYIDDDDDDDDDECVQVSGSGLSVVWQPKDESEGMENFITDQGAITCLIIS